MPQSGFQPKADEPPAQIITENKMGYGYVDDPFLIGALSWKLFSFVPLLGFIDEHAVFDFPSVDLVGFVGPPAVHVLAVEK